MISCTQQIQRLQQATEQGTAPDGIESLAEAKAVQEDIFPVANLRDIIASKKASGRMKDRLDLHLLELFRLEYETRKS